MYETAKKVVDDAVQLWKLGNGTMQFFQNADNPAAFREYMRQDEYEQAWKSYGVQQEEGEELMQEYFGRHLEEIEDNVFVNSYGAIKEYLED